jgi:hypothetical protein
MATEITMRLCCGNCRNCRETPMFSSTTRYSYDCRLDRKYGTLCDRWLPVRKDLGNKLWKADQSSSNAAPEPRRGYAP